MAVKAGQNSEQGGCFLTWFSNRAGAEPPSLNPAS